MKKNNLPIIYRKNTLGTNHKKKLYAALLIATAMVTMTACGKKGNSVSENLVNDNPGEIQIDESLLLSNTTEEEEEMIPIGESSGSTLTPINGEDINVSMNSASENSASENSASENSASENSANEAETTDAAPSATMATTEYKEAMDKPLTIGNISGLNITKLYITFNVGNMSNMEILGTETLKDGKSFEYTILDTSSIKAANKVTLSITAESGKQTLDFGSIDIYNPADMNVILATNGSGYYLYLE